MGKSNQKAEQRSWVGIVLVIIGFLFLLDSLDIMSFGQVFANWWPLILIFIGLAKLKGTEKTKGVVLFILGIVFLSSTLDIINWGNVARFWPLVLIAIGVSMVLKSGGRILRWGALSQEVSDDFVKASAIFGGADRIITADGFKGGDILALFGGVELDLTRAKLSPQGGILTLTALFGGIEVRVPPDWETSVSGTPIFGGIEDKASFTTEKSGGKIHCNCTVAFGGIEIRN